MQNNRLLTLFSRLFRNQDGASAVELALVGPIVFAFMLGTMEVGLVMFTNVAIEGAVRDGARYGITGSAPDGMSREDRLRQIISQRTFGLVTPESDDISMKVYPSFASVGQPEEYTDENGNGQWDAGEPLNDLNGNGVWDADPGVAGMGGSGEIVLYTVAYQLPIIAPALNNLFGVRVLNLSTRIVVRNEPWTPS